MNPYKTLLLVGPTGSGKTPLGDLLQEKGLWDKRCVHFDFGANLRKIAETPAGSSFFTKGEIDIITHSLSSGVLLENENFHIAEKILVLFAEEKNIGRDDLLILNGLPRHVGQARNIDSIVDINMLVYLEGTVKVIQERLHQNSGGDRTDRTDDSVQAIAKKLRIFHERTIPLLDYYESKNVKIEKIQISVDTAPDDIVNHLNATSCPFV